MDTLSFIDTNIGIAAVRRYMNAENRYFTQVWFRKNHGKWVKYHLFTTWDEVFFSPGMLEAFYINTAQDEIKKEYWW